MVASVCFSTVLATGETHCLTSAAKQKEANEGVKHASGMFYLKEPASFRPSLPPAVKRKHFRRVDAACCGFRAKALLVVASVCFSTVLATGETHCLTSAAKQKEANEGVKHEHSKSYVLRSTQHYPEAFAHTALRALSAW